MEYRFPVDHIQAKINVILNKPRGTRGALVQDDGYGCRCASLPIDERGRYVRLS
jgi:hypothetical protein